MSTTVETTPSIQGRTSSISKSKAMQKYLDDKLNISQISEQNAKKKQIRTKTPNIQIDLPTKINNYPTEMLILTQNS